MINVIKNSKRWVFPLIVVGVAYGIATVIRNSGPEIEVITPERPPLVVRTSIAQPAEVQLSVKSQGQVDSRYMIDLINEMPGQIASVDDIFVTGGYFRKGDVLLSIDPTDYRLAKVRAEAQVAEAREELEVEQSEAELASKGLFPLREAKVASAEARLMSAQADLDQAIADLRRTKVTAPFDGRVLFTSVDLGQYLTTGQQLGRIYSTDIAEIRLPLGDEQLRFLDLPFGSNSSADMPATPVTIKATVGGQSASWQGYIHRMEGAVDPDNRVWYAVARVDDPFGLQLSEPVVPLAVGLFVDAEIQGQRVTDVYELPRVALRNRDEVLVVDTDNRLRSRRVTVLRTGFDTVLLSDGVKAGDQVCLSPIEAFVDGLVVQPTVVDQLAVN